MENISINLSQEELAVMVKEIVGTSVRKSMEGSRLQLEKSINEYFAKGFLDNKSNQFERGLDWAIESAFRQGIEKAMEEVNLPEMITKKAKEYLMDEVFLKELTERIVRKQLGLDSDER